jgi:hypothetical protein
VVKKAEVAGPADVPAIGFLQPESGAAAPLPEGAGAGHEEVADDAAQGVARGVADAGGNGVVASGRQQRTVVLHFAPITEA